LKGGVDAMPLVLRYERDRHGFPRAIADAPHEPVGWYLEQDVQGSIADAGSLLDLVDAVESGRVPRWEGTGNAHHLTLAAGAAVVENVYAENVPPCRLTLAEFREAVSGWLAFVRADAFYEAADVKPPGSKWTDE
jgi:hypothetical protein